MTGSVEKRAVLVGSATLLRERGVQVSALEGLTEAARGGGRSAVFVAIDGQPAGAMIVEDPIKPTTKDAIQSLHREGVRIVMLTGDVARDRAGCRRRRGHRRSHCRSAPDEKRDVVERLQREGRVVAMAGDGINDAPALAAATVGIAMGTGTDVAIESAGITLVGGDLAGLARARGLSRATMKNIRQNLFLAFVYNAVGVPVAAGVLYPLLGVLISPIWASAAMTFSSVSVIVNALRLRNADLG